MGAACGQGYRRSRAARRGPRTSYFYSGGFHPFGATWGGTFKPTEVCQPLVFCEPGGGPPTPQPANAVPCITPPPTPSQSHGNPHNAPAPSKGKFTLPVPGPGGTTTTAAAPPAGILPVALFPLFVPLLTMLLGRRFKPVRPKRPAPPTQSAPRPARSYSSTTVTPSPPSPRSPGRTVRTQRMGRGSVRTASRSAPVPRPWITVTLARPASEASSR